MAAVLESLRLKNDELRGSLYAARRRADSLARPSFDYDGTGDSLARLVERLLRDRMRAAGDGAAELE